jgi:hypothetical protein
MPVYLNPDFRRLPAGPGGIFAKQRGESFFALPDWYAVMARYGVAKGTRIHLYTDERPESAIAMVLQSVPSADARVISSLANFYSVEHGIVDQTGANLHDGLAAICAELTAERPRWDHLYLSEFDPNDASYAAAVSALRQSGLLVECQFQSGTWYEETAGLNFPDYLAARPSALRNTWQRKRRRMREINRLTKAFFADENNIEQAISDYETIYAASWKSPEPFPYFIPELIRLSGKFGALRLGIYYIEGVPAAAQFWIFWRGRAVIYKLAHDHRFDNLSLGTLLTMEMFERTLELDRPYEINLGRGDDPYKSLWMSKRRERWGIAAANPRTIRGLRRGLVRELAKGYHRLRGELITPW